MENTTQQPKIGSLLIQFIMIGKFIAFNGFSICDEYHYHIDCLNEFRLATQNK